MAAAKLAQMAQRRVVVTGLGLLTPLGVNVESTWNSICSGQTAVRCLTERDDPAYGKQPQFLGARIGEEFEKAYWMQLVPQTKNLFNAFSASVVAEALAQSGWIPESSSDQLRTGLLLGHGLSSISCAFDTANVLSQKGAEALKRQALMQVSTCIALGEISQQFGFKGPVNSVSAEGASGQVAIGEAMAIVQRGEADVMIAVSSDHSTVPYVVLGSAKSGDATTDCSDPPSASRPFDSARSGFVVSEGAAALVLEELSHALKRDAPIIAELRSYSCINNGVTLEASPETSGAYRAMQLALQRSGLSPEHIDHISSHGASTVAGDLAEAQAIHRLFGSHKPVISANKSSLGNMFGAAGTVEAAVTAISIKRDVIPPILNMKTPLKLSDGAQLNFARRLVRQSVNAALSNSFGQSVHTSLVFTKYTTESA